MKKVVLVPAEFRDNQLIYGDPGLGRGQSLRDFGLDILRHGSAAENRRQQVDTGLRLDRAYHVVQQGGAVARAVGRFQDLDHTLGSAGEITVLHQEPAFDVQQVDGHAQNLELPHVHRVRVGQIMSEMAGLDGEAPAQFLQVRAVTVHEDRMGVDDLLAQDLAGRERWVAEAVPSRSPSRSPVRVHKQAGEFREMIRPVRSGWRRAVDGGEFVQRCRIAQGADGIALRLDPGPQVGAQGQDGNAEHPDDHQRQRHQPHQPVAADPLHEGSRVPQPDATRRGPAD